MDDSLSLPQHVLDCIPQTPECLAALDLARRELPEPIFNHSLRVFLIAHQLSPDSAADEGARADSLALLFVACICHDLGTCDRFNGRQRFEVEGADAAAALLQSHGRSEEDGHRVWAAVALHTSPGIAERFDPMTSLVRRAVVADFARPDALPPDLARLRACLPRLDVEKVLAHAVVSQAGPEDGLARPDSLTWPNTEKHPKSSWPGILLRAHLENPGFDGVNPAF
ncbi:hypothetical protein CDD83_4444 [Cordyceps sp. RAO-2017]|nr:hypothetical protein CDD83_4444 [Cordyceps sp. RAO-2017]